MKSEGLIPQITSSCSSVSLATNNRRTKQFHRRYLALCRAKNFHPLPELTGHGGGGACVRKVNNAYNHSWQKVDVYGDRFKETDWQLIIDALAEDTSLELLALRLRKMFNDVSENGFHRGDAVSDRPVILIKRLFTRLIGSLATFLMNNQSLQVLVLEAMPIQGIHMTTLVNGLQQNYSIVELDLSRSAIRDEGCEAICSVVTHLFNIETLNMSACQLTSRGCRAIAELVKYQKIERFSRSWQNSLRYGSPEKEKMQGLTILALNSNPCIGDDGLKEITEVLKEDEWIRQLLLRNCGLTDTGAKLLVDCLDFNKAIKKFDIRGNSGISHEALHEILIKFGDEDKSAEIIQFVPTEATRNEQAKPKASEQIKCLQQQLAAERHRATQMQILVERLRQQLYMQQEEFTAQLNTLKQESNAIINQRDELLNRVQRLERTRPKSKKTKLRKSKSATLPSHLMAKTSGGAIQGGRVKAGSKSEMTLRWVRDRRSTATSGDSTKRSRSHMIEDRIGDSGFNSQMNAIKVPENGHPEGGFGDMARLNDVTELSEDEYFAHVEEAADHHSDKSSFVLDEADDVEDAIDNSLSGEDIMKMFIRRKPTERLHDTQSVFLSVFNGDEN